MLTSTLKWLGNWAGTIVSLGAIVGLVIGFNSYFAKADDLKKVEARIEQKILFDRHDALEQRQWKQEDRYKSEANMPPEVREEYRRSKQEMAKIQKALDTYAKYNNSVLSGAQAK